MSAAKYGTDSQPWAQWFHTPKNRLSWEHLLQRSGTEPRNVFIRVVQEYLVHGFSAWTPFIYNINVFLEFKPSPQNFCLSLVVGKKKRDRASSIGYWFHDRAWIGN